MKSMGFYSIIKICIILSFSSHFTFVSAELNDERVKCATRYKTFKPISNFRFNCSVEILVPSTFTGLVAGRPNCDDSDYRSLFVDISPPAKNVTFFCTSNYAITVDMTFADGVVLKEYLNMKWIRKFSNFTNVSTYTYTLNIFPPNFPRNAKLGDAVKYTFSSLQFPSENIDVLWISRYRSTSDVSALSTSTVYWMSEKREVENLVQTSVGYSAFIPCASPYDINFQIQGSNKSKVYIHNATKFGAFLGAIEDKRDLIGQYGCLSKGRQYRTSLNFSVLKKSENYFSSYNVNYNDTNYMQAKAVLMSSQKRFDDFPTTRLFDIHGMNFELQCRSLNRNVTLQQINVTLRDLTDTVNYKLLRLNPGTLSTKYITPVVDVNDTIAFACLDIMSNETLEGWEIQRRDDLSEFISYNRKKHEIQCVQLALLGTEITFKHEECQNLATCKLAQKLVVQKNSTVNGLSSCPSSNFINQCVGLKPFKKGVAVCTAEFDKDQSNEISQTYFMGFDQIFYIGNNKEPPKEAIIKLINIGPNEQIMVNNVPVQFKFYCEVHSFYFEEGIQWLFEYKNQTRQLIPSKYINDKNDYSPSGCDEEYINPSSSVNILVPDININRIVCMAPRLDVVKSDFFTKWAYEKVNISVFEAIAPTIADTGFKSSFHIGELNRQITCQANGLPKPKIQWTAKSGQNLLEDFIIDLSIYSVLRFPIYNESYEGDYICTASNEVGNASRKFSVGTSSKDTWKWLLIAGFFLILLIIICVMFYCYTKKLKMKQSLEMEGIIKLLNGRTNNGDAANTTDPLEMEYDKNWELEKHSFCIDESKILGFGEFGIVFKGTVAKRNVDVAFKSLKSTGNLIHLKSLVSELKLLMYIGKHNNIVELIGAYTKEIKNGILYVAMEFCALGSLESYLRSNKGRFLKCPFLTSNNEYANVLQETRSELPESSNHTISALLKWCSEISSAMDFLYSKKVIHGDLATRNILLTVDWTTKLTDFGLSRRTYTSNTYVKKGQDPLPWRWLALEAIKTQVFDVKTDVWSFGITLWEIFSLGEVPYPGISFREVVTELEKGFRNPMPKYASKQLYDVMVECWHFDGEARPSFASLSLLFKNATQHEHFHVNLKDIVCIGSTPKESIEYSELDELTSSHYPNKEDSQNLYEQDFISSFV